MKSIHFLPPVLALAICGAWISVQQHTIANLERRTSLLRKEIAARQASDDARDAAGMRSSSSREAFKGGGPIDLEKTAAQLMDARKIGGLGYMREIERLKKRLMAMDKEELAAALGKIASLELAGSAKQILEMTIIGALVEKDPAFALERFSGLINDQNFAGSWQFAHGFGKWAEKDLTAAVAWFDRQIAAGVFESKSLDGKSGPRTSFEGSLIGVLLASHPEDAARRIAALPQDQRADILKGNVIDAIKPESQAAYVKLVRQSLQEKESLEAISKLVSRSATNSEGYAPATEIMDRIGATPAERRACVEEIAEWRFNFKKISKEDIDGLRDWAAVQSPDAVNRATGKALAASKNYTEAAALALDYHGSGGGDELLVPLLENGRAEEYKKQALELAAKLSDEALRAKFFKKLE